VTAVVDRARLALRELEAMVDALDPAELEAAVVALAEAPRIFVTGVGRSGLAVKAVGMRLMHVGKTVHVVGEVTAPAIASGDLLVAASTSGRGSLLAQAHRAVDAGASVLAITGGENELAALAAVAVVLPARTRVSTVQHAGSLFEQACLVVGDALCAVVQQRLDVPTETLERRHANIL
jgi:6-phospho-3-hexuloisomerase